MKRVLIVDDDNDFRAITVASLKSGGYGTMEADNGATALDLAKAHHPDLIISDVMMDSGSGFMLQELLRDDAQTSAIPLILMTGAAQMAGSWGADPHVGYLSKPFSVSELFAAVEQKLDPKSRE
jgi:CheY-like chemotaxis protein